MRHFIDKPMRNVVCVMSSLGWSCWAARLGQPDPGSGCWPSWQTRPGGMRLSLDRIFELGDPPEYEPEPHASIAARAQAAGCSAEELLYDLLLTGGGTTLLYLPALNFSDGNLDAAAELLAHPHCVPGLGDGGAHVGTICDASFPTTLLTLWTRDRRRGSRFDVPWVVRQQCRATAETVGLLDRGVIAPGYKADLNVIDHDHLRLGPPTIAHDLPAGGKRLLQSAVGYLHTIVSGTETYRDGQPTGDLPGRLVRGPQPEPGNPGWRTAQRWSGRRCRPRPERPRATGADTDRQLRAQRDRRSSDGGRLDDLQPQGGERRGIIAQPRPWGVEAPPGGQLVLSLEHLLGVGVEGDEGARKPRRYVLNGSGLVGEIGQEAFGHKQVGAIRNGSACLTWFGSVLLPMARTGSDAETAAQAVLAKAQAQAIGGIGPALYPADAQ